MTTYVLVPGGWLGGWAWDKVADKLRAGGHEAIGVTLTGESLNDHIASVIEAIGDREDVVLVGQSYGGTPVTGAADRIPERISRLVFVESAPLPAGMAAADFAGPEGRAAMEQLVVDGMYPLPDWDTVAAMGNSLEGLDEEMLAEFREKAVALPWRAMTDPLELPGPGRGAMPCDLVACSIPLPLIKELAEAGNPLFATVLGPEWTIHELPTGHWPMFSRPDDLADLLAKLS